MFHAEIVSRRNSSQSWQHRTLKRFLGGVADSNRIGVNAFTAVGGLALICSTKVINQYRLRNTRLRSHA